MTVGTEPNPADAQRLRHLSDLARPLHYDETDAAERVRLDRDGLIRQMALDGVSVARIAHVAGMHRTMVHRIKRSFPERLRRWQERHPAAK